MVIDSDVLLLNLQTQLTSMAFQDHVDSEELAKMSKLQVTIDTLKEYFRPYAKVNCEECKHYIYVQYYGRKKCNNANSKHYRFSKEDVEYCEDYKGGNQ